MASVNKCIIIGNLGKDPETKYTPAGLQITKFSLATTERVKKGDSYEDETTWHNIVTFSKTAEIAQNYLKKGSQVYLEGRISNKQWEDQSGNKKYWSEIIANNLTMLGKKETSTVAAAGNYGEQQREMNAFEKQQQHDESSDLPY